MNPQTSSFIEDSLHRYGWSFTKIAKGIFITGWASECRDYPLRIIVDETIVTFQVQPLAIVDQSLLESPEILSYFLELNYHYHLAKLAIDEVGDLCLSISTLCSNIDFDQFSNCLGILAFYAEELFMDLERLANPKVLSQSI